MSHFFLSLKTSINNFKIRGVARGGQRDRAPPPPRNLADQLTLFKPGWACFAPHTTASLPGFKKLSTPLKMIDQLIIE